VLLGGENWRRHRTWFVTFVVASLVATLAYFGSAWRSGRFPGGSSVPGFTFGVLGGLIILFELLLWFRKKRRAWRIGRAQDWLRAHIWLGLLCVPLLVYHSGFQMGGTLSATLMVLLFIVIASGVWGLAVQQWLPERMLERVSAETIYSQIERRAGQLTAEGKRLVRATCGPAAGEDEKEEEDEEAEDGAYLVVGAVRSVGKVQGKVLETRVPAPPVPGAEPLRAFFDDTVAVFLREGARCGSPLARPDRSAALFADLRGRLPAGAHAAVDTLESFCDQRRQLDLQARLQFWLHNWLWIHFPLSVALVVLMFVHIWVALKYW
jgi:hypothetical protein